MPDDHDDRLTILERAQLLHDATLRRHGELLDRLEEELAPVVAVPEVAPASPLLPMTGRNGASSAPKTLLNRPSVIAARKKTTQ